MRIVKIIIYRVRLPLKIKFVHSRSSRNETENVVVEAVTDRGVSGFGEGVPRSYVTGETPSSALDYLYRMDYSFLKDPCSSLKQGVERHLEWETGGKSESGAFFGAARCALGLSVLDALTRSWDAGFDEISRFAPGLLGPAERPGRVRYSAVCSGGSVASALATLLKYRLYDFKSVKLKVGWGERKDMKLARIARMALGRKVDIRVDANGAWDAASAIKIMRGFERYGISSVEEPLSPAAGADLPELRKRVNIPIMLDESVCDAVQLRNAVESASCDLVNIRLSKCGGFFASQRMANILAENGLGYQLGCQVGESGILSSAGRRFGFLVPGIRHLEGSYDRHLLKNNITLEDITFGYGGWAGPLKGPGLGVTVARHLLDRRAVEKREIEI